MSNNAVPISISLAVNMLDSIEGTIITMEIVGLVHFRSVLIIPTGLLSKVSAKILNSKDLMTGLLQPLIHFEYQLRTRNVSINLAWVSLYSNSALLVYSKTQAIMPFCNSTCVHFQCDMKTDAMSTRSGYCQAAATCVVCQNDNSAYLLCHTVCVLMHGIR